MSCYMRIFFFLISLTPVNPECSEHPVLYHTSDNSNKIYTLWGANQIQKILKSHQYILQDPQVLIKVWKDGPQKLISGPQREGPTNIYSPSSQGTKAPLLDSLLTNHAIEENREQDIEYTCEPLRSQVPIQNTNECHSNEHPKN